MGARSNVVLTGFMATGKTTVGRVLADRLGYDFVDTDAVIEQRHGPIPAIFADHGEAWFRELERAVAREVAAGDGLVVATGGRMLVDPSNAEVLGATGDIVCLTATVDTLARRLGADAVASRPVLAGADLRDRITELLAERASAYARFAAVATDDRSPDEIADAVLDVIGRSHDDVRLG